MAPNCPPQDALRRYLIGDYSDEQGAEIEQHLSECEACEDTLAGFDDTKDLLLRHLPLAVATAEHVETPESSSRPAWLDRLKAGLPTASVEHADARADKSVSDHADSPIGGLESYDLLGILGRGGMGVVYRARHRQLGRPVAIKVVHPKLTSALNVRDRFEQEIRIMGRMNHPGIVMATDAGRVGPAAYLVMELIDGIDLARLVRQEGPLAIGQATEIARQIAEALAAAHEANAIHRDVKPSNVMLDTTGRAKLLDFGLAHLTERANKHHETSLGHVLGTLDYMAPEQAEGKAVQSSTDLYGLGALLFFLLTGQPPHGASPDRTLLQQLRSITSDDARPLSSVRADVPDELNRLVASLLARDPDDRPTDARQVAQSLFSWVVDDSLGRLTEGIKPDHQLDDSGEVDRSLCALLGVEPTTELKGQISHDASATGATPKSDSQLFRNIGVLTAIAAGIAAICFGFVMIFDTPTGKVQIKSDIAGIQVELLDEQDRATKLTVEQKEKTTELKVGKYRVRILEPHDGATLDKDTITLTKGETTIATISQLAKNKPGAPGSGISPTGPAPLATDVASAPDPRERTTPMRSTQEIEFYVTESGKLLGPPAFHGDDVVGVSTSKPGNGPTTSIAIMLTREVRDEVVKLIDERGGIIGKQMTIVSRGDKVAVAIIRPVRRGLLPQIKVEGEFTISESENLVELIAELNSQHGKPVNPSSPATIVSTTPVRNPTIEFYIVDPDTEAISGTPVLVATDIESAIAEKKPGQSYSSINITLTEEAGDKLAKVTAANLGNKMAIIFKGKVVSAPIIHSTISRRVQISGSRDEIVAEIMDSLPREIVQPAVAGDDGSVYEGHPRSYWVRQFDTDNSPQSKLAAVAALHTFVAGTPEEQVRQHVEIAGDVLDSMYGGKTEDAAFAFVANSGPPAVVWPDSEPKMGRVRSAVKLRKSVEGHLSQLPKELVVRELVKIVSTGKPSSAAFAIQFLTSNKSVGRGKSVQPGVMVALMDELKGSTVKIDQACLLLRARIHRRATEEQQSRFVDDMIAAGRELAEQGVNDENRDFARAWIASTQKWKRWGIALSGQEKTRVRGIDPKVVAKIVLSDLLSNEDAFAKHFYRHWATDSSPFQDGIVSVNRKYSAPLWDDWVGVANEWLAENDSPENQLKVNRVLKTFRLVLPTRLESDQWDVKTSAEVMTKHLQSYYQADEPPRDGAVDAHDLLTNLILCGGSIPDFVVADSPANPEIRKRLAEFREVVNSDLSYNEYKRRVAAAKGLIQVAPFHTVKCIMTATKRPSFDSGSRLGLTRLIKDASDIDTEVRHAIGSTSHIPPINPLLLLAITSELSQEHGAAIDYRELKSDEKLFYRHLRDALKCPTIVGSIASRWHQQMYENASDEKKKEIEVLTPSLKRR